MIFEEILIKIENNEQFSFSRWGDGEWICMLNPDNSKGNCDGHKYFDTLSDALKNILKSKPKYNLGIQGHARRSMGEKIDAFLKENDLTELQWSNADVFHHASIKGKFHTFIKLLKARDNIMLIAPPDLMQLGGIANISFVIPAKDCWTKKDETIKNVKEYLEEKNRPYILLFCAGMPANVMIDELYNWNPNHTYLDMGSVFDPYAGKVTRSYHKEIIVKLNA
jgi:hypothetical protein